MHLSALEYADSITVPEDDGKPETKLKIDRITEHIKTMEDMMVTYFAGLPYRLPCSACAQHLLYHYSKNPYEEHIRGTRGTMKLFEYTVLLHNVVNKMLSKRTYSVEEALKHYESLFATNNKEGLQLLLSIRDGDTKRKQDSQKIKELEDELESYRNGKEPEEKDDTADEEKSSILTNGYLVSLSVVSLLIFITILYLCLR